jgi:hypothetical protein
MVAAIGGAASYDAEIRNGASHPKASAEGERVPIRLRAAAVIEAAN